MAWLAEEVLYIFSNLGSRVYHMMLEKLYIYKETPQKNSMKKPDNAVVQKCISLEYHSVQTLSYNDTTVSGCIQNRILSYYIEGEKEYGTNSQYS